MSQQIRIATIGYAFMGRAHSGAWRNVRSAFDVPTPVQQVLVGRQQEEVSAAAQRYGWAEAVTDWREVIDREDIDVVDICTPGNSHAEIAIAALEAGKHVLVEKPLANTLAEAEAMVAAAESAASRGAVSMVGFNYRRVPALAHARNLIAAGAIGRVRQVRAAYLQDWLTDDGAPMTWRLRAETAGSGALGDIASHAVDMVQFLTGATVAEVSGRLQTFVPERSGPEGPEQVTVDDAAWLTLGLSDEAVASVEASRVAAGRKNALRIEVYGSEGGVTFDLERLNELELLTGGPGTEEGYRRIVMTEGEHPYLDGWWPPGHIIGWEHTFIHQARDFLRAIADGGTPRPSFADGLAVQRVLDAAIESAKSRSAVVALT